VWRDFYSLGDDDRARLEICGFDSLFPFARKKQHRFAPSNARLLFFGVRARLGSASLSKTVVLVCLPNDSWELK
jgi:hypothetical protein